MLATLRAKGGECLCYHNADSAEVSVSMGAHSRPTILPASMEMMRYDTLGDLLKRYRMAAGLTQDELAERAQLSARTIGNIERGTLHRPRRDSLRLLAAALDLAPDQYARLCDALTSTPVLSTATPHNLPAPLTPLLGREHEVAAACAFLRQPDMRLLTFTGPPGSGKTRLSLQVGADLLTDFTDGVYFVALAALRDPAQVAPAIAQALGLPDTTATRPPTDALRLHLRERRALLVLDNFEQVLAANELVADLLGACPEIKILITSRAPLHLRGEQEFSVPPLGLPEPEDLVAPDDLGDYAAIALFVQRAHSVQAFFTLTTTNAPIVAAICRRLDGLPLALELAAARIRLLPPPALLSRLDNRLRLLSDGPTDLPERQRTLHSAIAWSYDLLTDSEQHLFRRLAVFSGGWTLDAAGAVCYQMDEPHPDIMDTVTSLMEQSLVHQEQTSTSEPRFGMLETLRAYAYEQVRACGELDTLRRRHAEHFLTLAEAAAPHLTGPGQALWLGRLAVEYDNLRAALEWAREHTLHTTLTPPAASPATSSGDALEIGLRLAGALGVYWSVRGPVSEGRMWLDDLLALAEQRAVAPAVGARALLQSGRLAEHAHNQQRAGERLQASQRLYREVGDASGAAAALNRLGILALDSADYEGALAWLAESLRLRRALGDITNVANTLSNMGVVAMQQGDDTRAALWQEEAIACFRAAGSATPTMAEGAALVNLGFVAQRQGDLSRSENLLEQSLALFQQLGAGAGIAVCQHLLGNVARERGERTGAWALYAHGLTAYHSDANMQGVAQCLEDIARLLFAQDEYERAACLWGAVETLRAGASDLRRPPGERPRCQRDIAALRAVLGDARFATLWAKGKGLALDDVLALALVVTE